MKVSRSAALRVAVALLAFGGILTFGATAADAGGKAQTFTDHIRNETETFYDYSLCAYADSAARITTTTSGVFHVTELANGTYHVTGTFHGTFYLEHVQATLVEGEDELVPVPADPPVDTTKPTFTGRFTQWFGENSNLNNGNGTFTFRVHGVGSDGSVIRFNVVAHFSANANGVEISFEKENCH